jgi:hypothetical protein
MNSKPNLFKLTDELLFRIDHIDDEVFVIADVGIGQSDKYVSLDKKTRSFDGHYELHFHCVKHPEVEMSHDEIIGRGAHHQQKDTRFVCHRCEYDHWVRGWSYDQVVQQALSAFNAPHFKDAKLIRLDDIYTPELKVEFKGDEVKVKTKESIADGYKLVADVKKDKDGDSLVMLQIFKDKQSKGAQFFIKPEKGQLSSDHNNPNPADFITEINVKLKDREMSQKFEREQ